MFCLFHCVDLRNYQGNHFFGIIGCRRRVEHIWVSNVCGMWLPLQNKYGHRPITTRRFIIYIFRSSRTNSMRDTKQMRSPDRTGRHMYQYKINETGPNWDKWMPRLGLLRLCVYCWCCMCELSYLWANQHTHSPAIYIISLAQKRFSIKNVLVSRCRCRSMFHDVPWLCRYTLLLWNEVDNNSKL